jgi:hypothetical protein
VQPDPGRADRRVLSDAEGPVGPFLYAERDGRWVADRFEPQVSIDRAVAAARQELPGWRIAGGEELAGASELFRDPAYRPRPRPRRAGDRARPRRRGRPAALSLAVTEGNPAIGLSEALGFRRVASALSVDL